MWFLWLGEYLTADALVFFIRVVWYAYFVHQTFALNLMQLKAEGPRVVAEEETREFFVGEDGDAVTFSVVCLSLHLGYGILPFVEEHGAAWTVGEDEVGLVGFHRLELLLRVGDAVASIFLHKVLSETEAAAVSAFWIVDYLAAPCFYHSRKHIGKLGLAHSVMRKDLGIMAADMLHHAEWPARETVDELVLHARLKVKTELVDDVARVNDVVGHFELTLAGSPKILSGLLLQLWMLFPLGHNFGENTETGDARWDIVAVAALIHERKKTCNNRHGCVKGHHVGVIADTRAGMLVRIVADILAKFLAEDSEKGGLRAGEEGLADAATLVEVMIWSYFFLVLVPVAYSQVWIYSWG